MTVWNIVILVLITIILGNVFAFVDKYFKERKIERLMTNFVDYTGILTYFMDKSYDIVYKDKILTYSLEATKVNDSEFSAYTKDFCNLTQKLMGPKLVKEFIYLYGNEDTFLFNLVEFFNSKYESDEIRKSSMDELMNKDIEEEDSGGTK